jgi:hypothetical protein
MATVFARHGEQLRALLQKSEGRPVDVQDVFSRFTFDSFAEIAYGVHFDSLNDAVNEKKKGRKQQNALMCVFQGEQVLQSIQHCAGSKERKKNNNL